VPTDVDAVPFIGHGPCNTAHILAALKNDGTNVGPLEQFVGSGESRGPRSNNDSDTGLHM